MDNWQDFDGIYEQFFTPVFRYINLRVRSRAEAEDLAQTVFLKAYQANPPGKDGKPPEPLTLNYFFTVARNTVIDHWRKKKDVLVDEETVFEVIPDTSSGPADDAQRGEMGVAMRAALEKVSEAEQEVLILRFVNELSTKEIADTLGKTEGAIRQLQSRGLRSLRGHMKEEDM